MAQNKQYEDDDLKADDILLSIAVRYPYTGKVRMSVIGYMSKIMHGR